MKASRILQTALLLVLSICINWNAVDDRFVSPIEDLSHQYQSYELEETTRLSNVSLKKQNPVLFVLENETSLLANTKNQKETWEREDSDRIVFFLLPVRFLSLPPPSLV
ncbi:hypothetical protein LPTSP4_11220 [Leptospira ryugenii]|uniref:Uncharacterized protein n=1 Tax=Leptospira ryugenii TaxID=1917863 RepID=A0A2P2DYD0_9LEPT|nr:hypothetical protein [Leptospira ryugenii]GBF49606.1 hypothetical protein LPTSP4_11220 [Leptospira ryugenii]